VERLIWAIYVYGFTVLVVGLIFLL